MRKMIISLFLIIIQGYPFAQSGSISTTICVGCTVVRGKNLVAFSADTSSPSTIKQCGATDSKQSSAVGECKIACPKGSSICVTQCTSEYVQTEDGQLLRMNDPDSENTKIYTDSGCTELWDPNKKKYHTYASDKEYYRIPLFCKKELNKNVNGKSEKIVISLITVYY